MKKIIPMLSVAACLSGCNEAPKVEINENDIAVLCFEKEISYFDRSVGRNVSQLTYFFDTNNDGLIDCVGQYTASDKNFEHSYMANNLHNNQSYTFTDLSSCLKVNKMPKNQSTGALPQVITSLEEETVTNDAVFKHYSAIIDVTENNSAKKYICKWNYESPENAAMSEAIIFNMQKGAIYTSEVIKEYFSTAYEIPSPKKEKTLTAAYPINSHTR